MTILLLEHRLINYLISTHSINLYCSVHNKLVDFKTGKITKKPKATANIEEFQALSSKVKLNFYIDVSKLYQELNSSESFRGVSRTIESLRALSILTGHDKSPGIRHVTKSLALTVYQDVCKEGLRPSLVDRETGKLTNNNSCKDAFKLLLARIYFHMLRVTIRKLSNITWDVVISNGTPNFKLLRDIGCQYAKGQLDKTPPVDGALEPMFLRAIFLANEYDQIFSPLIDYSNPLEYGFEDHKGGKSNVYCVIKYLTGVIETDIRKEFISRERKIDNFCKNSACKSCFSFPKMCIFQVYSMQKKAKCFSQLIAYKPSKLELQFSAKSLHRKVVLPFE